MKICKSCNKQLDLSYFIKDGKEYKTCQKCRDYAKEYVRRNPEKTRNSQKLYRKNNADKVKKREQLYRKNNIEKVRERDKISQKKRRQEHPEEYLQYRLEYQEANKDRIKEFDKNRMLNRPEYFLFSSARGRARKRKLDFNITEQDIKELLDTTPICPLRKTNFERGSNYIPNDNSISLDRIDSSKGYIRDNVRIISHKANLIKNDINLETFRKIIKNFDCFVLKIHDVDCETIRTIIEDREKYIESEALSTKDKSRFRNIETYLLGSARKRALKNNLDLNIDKNYIMSIWPLDNKCPILNKTFIFGKKVVSDMSATIDRIDNNKGYIKGNIRIISAKANSVKNKETLEGLKFILKNWEELELNRKKNDE